jgi:hypothetical protein
MPSTDLTFRARRARNCIAGIAVFAADAVAAAAIRRRRPISSDVRSQMTTSVLLTIVLVAFVLEGTYPVGQMRRELIGALGGRGVHLRSNHISPEGQLPQVWS